MTRVAQIHATKLPRMSEPARLELAGISKRYPGVLANDNVSLTVAPGEIHGLIDGEPGADFVPALAPKAGDMVISKPGKGAFYGTPLGDILRLRGITHLIFGGVTTEVCVQTTMREANDRGYECLLIEDATESYFPEFKAGAMAMIRA